MVKTALITGAARRIGAAIAETLHAAGYRVAIHCHRSAPDGRALADKLNRVRTDSAIVLAADLADAGAAARLIEHVAARWECLDVLVNNASVYETTTPGMAQPAQWESIMAVNLRAPFFLCQAAAGLLAARRGSIVNITDIYAERPQPGYAVYCISKAGLLGLTRALARDLAPDVRVNAVAPGAILWPATASTALREQIIRNTPLSRHGNPGDIAQAVRFLAGAEFVTGQVLEIDGGRMLHI